MADFLRIRLKNKVVLGSTRFRRLRKVKEAAQLLMKKNVSNSSSAHRFQKPGVWRLDLYSHDIRFVSWWFLFRPTKPVFQ